MAQTQRDAVCIYKGKTRHTRFIPFRQSFAYRLFLINIDIDRLAEAEGVSRLFSVEKPNLFSFRREDHGTRERTDLRPWADDQFTKAGIDLEGGMIRLLTLPRHLFYKFAPISLWLGYGPDQDLRGIIYEVNNTFGDSHAYVAPIKAGRNQHMAQKNLYVSPFFDVSGRYRFTLNVSEEKLGLIVDNIEDGQRLHMASLTARQSKLTSGALLQAMFSRPFSTLGVSVGIHYQALKLWLKKAGYRRRPAAHPTKTSLAKPIVAPHIKNT